MSKRIIDINILIDKYRMGDLQAKELLYNCFYGSVLTIAKSYAKDEADANVIVDKASKTIFKYITIYNNNDSSVHEWVKAITIREALLSIKNKEKEKPKQKNENHLRVKVIHILIAILLTSIIVLIILV